MAGVKTMLMCVEVILAYTLALTGWSSYKWFKTYRKNQLEMQNALYDFTVTKEEVEELDEIADESKRYFQFALAWSIVIVVLSIGIMGIISVM